jgi:hypothetical protein
MQALGCAPCMPSRLRRFAAKPREKCGLAISDSMAQKNKMVGCWPCVHKIVEFAGWIAHEFR